MGFLDLTKGLTAGRDVGLSLAKKVRRPELETKAREETQQQLYTPPEIAGEMYKGPEVFTKPLQSAFKTLTLALPGVAPYLFTKGATIEAFKPTPTLPKRNLLFGGAKGIFGDTSFLEIPQFKDLAPQVMKGALKTSIPIAGPAIASTLSDEALSRLAELGIDVMGMYGMAKAPEFARMGAAKIPDLVKQRIVENIPSRTFRVDYNFLQGATSGRDPVAVEAVKDIELTLGQGTTRNLLKQARKSGYVNVEIPGKTIVKWADKPWWSKIKQRFGDSRGFARTWKGKSGPEGFKKELKALQDQLKQMQIIGEGNTSEAIELKKKIQNLLDLMGPKAGGLPTALTPQEKSQLDKMNPTERKTIRLTRDVTVKDVFGNSKTYKKGHEITIYKDPSTGKALAKDGTKGIVPNKATQQIEQAGIRLGQKFAPELKGVEEVVKGKAIITEEQIKREMKVTGRNREEVIELLEEMKGEVGEGTKFSQYQLPGGKNYREVLIKAPTKQGKPSNKPGKFLEPEGQFKSSHWDEPNVLAHLRLNDRTTPDGKKVLFVEELQSDWAREARKPQNLDDIKHGNATPQHPLLKNWQELALKRVIKEAVEGGYDYISWTTGEQQAERYDLSKQVDNIEWSKKKDTGLYTLILTDKNGNVDRGIQKIAPEDLPRFIGKDAAQKILDSSKKFGTLSNLDLKIGGEWAKNLYDRQVPNILKDLTKGVVETISLSTPTLYGKKGASYPIPKGKTLTQPALKITPEVRAKVIGQPAAGGMTLWDEKGFAINPEKLAISSEGKAKIHEVSKALEDELTEIKGSRLTHEEIIQAAKEAELLKAAMTKEEMAKLIGAVTKTRQHLAALAEEKTVTPEFIETLKTVSSEGTFAGRLLESFDIEALPEYAQTKIELLKKLTKAGFTVDEIVKASQGVDFNDQGQVTKFYRQFIKPTLWELITEYRYINLLSSPLTHIVNATSNAIQVAGLSPITKLVSGLIDPVASSMFGIERSHYLKQVPAYYQGVLASTGNAVTEAWKVLVGQSRIRRPDIRHIPTGAKILKPLEFVPRALEAADVFFRTMAEAGELESHASLVGEMDSVKLEKAKELARRKAEYYIFRNPLDPSNKGGQGHLLASIDKFTSGVYKLRSFKPVAWYVPFVQTPMSIAKQGIEYSPLGYSTLAGAKDKVEQLSKAIIGSLLFAGAGYLALKGRTTWSAPRGKKEKELFYASGRKPYSIKIGDKWVSYSKIGPIAYPIAMAAALQWFLKENPKALTDTTMQRWTKGLGAIAGFFSDQSYLEGLGDILKAAQGDASALSQSMTNIPQQLVPLSSLLRWTTNIIDPIFRDTDKALSLDSLVQSVQKGIPGLSQKLPAKLDSKGQPLKRSYPIINAFNPFSMSKEELSEEERLQQYRAKQSKSALKKYIDDTINEINSLKKQGRDDEAESLREKAKRRANIIRAQLKQSPQRNGFLTLIP